MSCVSCVMCRCHVWCHVSCVMCHMWCVMCHMWCVMCGVWCCLKLRCVIHRQSFREVIHEESHLTLLSRLKFRSVTELTRQITATTKKTDMQHHQSIKKEMSISCPSLLINENILGKCFRGSLSVTNPRISPDNNTQQPTINTQHECLCSCVSIA